jgi:hypothetical protein
VNAEPGERPGITPVAALAVLGLAMMLPFDFVVFRYLSFTNSHGGGVPHVTEEGNKALNDHGQITLVSESVYEEASRRYRLLFITGAATVVAGGAVHAWASHRWLRRPRSWKRRNDCSPLDGRRFAIQLLIALIYLVPMTGMMILWAPLILRNWRGIAYTWLCFILLGSPVSLLVCRHYRRVEKILETNPDAYDTTNLEWHAEQFYGGCSPLTLCQIWQRDYARWAKQALGIGIVIGIVILVLELLHGLA